MRHLLVTARLDSLTADESDSPTMQWAIRDLEQGGGSTLPQLCDTIQEAMNFQGPDMVRPLTSYFASTLNRGVDTGEFKVYDVTDHLDGSPHGSPIWTQPLEITAAALATSLPPQVAACLTLRARDALSFPVEAPDGADEGFQIDRPRQRRTGRQYLGPLNTLATNGNTSTGARPRQEFVDDAVAYAENLQEDLNDEGMAWCVWSRTNESFSVITRAEMDDSFDVIRSRKVSATSRSVRIFAPVPDLALGA